jgi:hypothetical protein
VVLLLSSLILFLSRSVVIKWGLVVLLFSRDTRYEGDGLEMVRVGEDEVRGIEGPVHE